MLEELVEYYEHLRETEPAAVPAPGWSSTRVVAFLDLDRQGNLTGIIPTEDEKGEICQVPRQVERSSGVAANLLCDKSDYLLGVGSGKPSRVAECFEAARKLHEEALASCESANARAIASFFQNWNPESASSNPVIAANKELLLSGKNLAFCVNGYEALNDTDVQAFVDGRAFNQAEGEVMASLISGERKPAARLHPKIKGIPGAQSSGAVLVGFNAPSVTSYGRDDDQGLNAPIGDYEAFAYAAALNYLIADPAHHVRIGDTTIVYWALCDDELCSPQFSQAININAPWSISNESAANCGLEDPDHTLDAIFQNARRGRAIGSAELDAPFCVLGLSPNNARVSVRFFLKSTFGDVIANLDKHYQRLQIAHHDRDTKYLSPLRLVRDVSNPNTKNAAEVDILVGSLMRSILTNGRYPESLFQQAILRIRASRDNDEKKTRKVNYGRAAIAKAYLIRNCGVSEKELTVELNEGWTNVPYCLGRLFSLMERLQTESARLDGRTVNSTIVDRYFNAACATPGVVFPVIEKLGMSHLSKLQKHGRGAREAQLYGQLIETISAQTEKYPTRLTIEEQGNFISGYWCQRQAWFKKVDTAAKETQED